MSGHSLWNASGMERHLACTASVPLNTGDSSSEAADEGTRAHELAEQLLKGRWPAMTEEQETNLAIYTQWIAKLQDALYDSVLKVEYRTEHPTIDDLGGTADAVVIGNEIMHDSPKRLVVHINDLKYGHHPVGTAYNMQLMTYMLLVYRSELAKQYGFNTDTVFRGSIIQPRTSSDRIDVWEVKAAELEALEKRIQEAQAAEPSFAAGHWCRYCNHKVECEAFREQTLQLATQAFPEEKPEDPTPTQEQLDKARQLWDLKPAITNLFDDLEKWMIRAVRSGAEFPGLKVIQALGNRAWTVDEEVAFTKLRGRGLGKKLTSKTKIMTPAQIEKVAKAKKLDPAKVLKDIVGRKELGHKIAKESHYRPAVEFTQPTEAFGSDWSDDDLGSVLD